MIASCYVLIGAWIAYRYRPDDPPLWILFLRVLVWPVIVVLGVLHATRLTRKDRE